MYSAFLYFQSAWRYVVLGLLLFAIIRSFMGMYGKKEYSDLDNKIGMYAMIASHIQLLSGILLLAVSPFLIMLIMDFGTAMREKEIRFFTIEHPIMMIIAVGLITVGKISSKKITDPVKKHKKIFWFYLIALLIILYSVPWPFKEIARPWLR